MASHNVISQCSCVQCAQTRKFSAIIVEFVEYASFNDKCAKNNNAKIEISALNKCLVLTKSINSEAKRRKTLGGLLVGAPSHNACAY